jgi:hypothetical protein
MDLVPKESRPKLASPKLATTETPGAAMGAPKPGVAIAGDTEAMPKEASPKLERPKLAVIGPGPGEACGPLIGVAIGDGLGEAMGMTVLEHEGGEGSQARPSPPQPTTSGAGVETWSSFTSSVMRQPRARQRATVAMYLGVLFPSTPGLLEATGISGRLHVDVQPGLVAP